MKRTSLLMFILLSMNISMYGHVTMPQVKKVTTISMHLATLVTGSFAWYFKYAGKQNFSKNYLGGLLITYSILNLLEIYTADKQNKKDNENPRIAAA